MGGILEEIGMLGRGLMRGSKSGNVPRLLAREAESGLATRFAPPPATAPMAAPVAPSGIDALHASPHDFQKFEWSPRTRGTGEGAQAYGEGLYFAESPDTMEEYYKQFASKNDPRPKLWSFIADAKRYARKNKGNGPIDANMIREELALQDHPDLKALAGNDRALEAMARMSNYDLNTPGAVPEYMLEDARYLESVMPAGKAHRYAVKLKADPEHFLDWDKPLSEQPKAVQDLVAEVPRLVRGFESPTGESVYRGLTAAKGTAATKVLGARGIPGIKYLDAGSRGAGTGSRNYVVWDDSIIEVVKKFGIAGALGAGLITQEMADQMQAQGVPDSVSHKTSPGGPSAMPTRERFGG